jgi:hypothetical protein
VAYAEKGITSSMITWVLPNATDNSDKAPNITCVTGYLPHVRLSQGMYHVTYIAADSANNRAACSFKITVKG